MNMNGWHYALLFLVIGYAISYWFPQVGDMTLGKLHPRG